MILGPLGLVIFLFFFKHWILHLTIQKCDNPSQTIISLLFFADRLYFALKRVTEFSVTVIFTIQFANKQIVVN